jgi:glycosyltransferase involved in cell wall biosynthesis
MVIKEAAACGLPVVSTDVGFAREVLDGVAGSTVGTTEAALVAGLERALEADGRAGGRDAVDGGFDRMAEQLLTLYTAVLNV